MRTIAIILLLFLSLRAFAPSAKSLWIERIEPIRPYEKIWNAITKIESSNNPYAINVKEQAFGIGQIRLNRLDDYNHRFNKKVSQMSLFDVETSRIIFLSYVSKYDPNDIKGICREWNGKSSKNKYYAKVQQELNK